MFYLPNKQLNRHSTQQRGVLCAAVIGGKCGRGVNREFINHADLCYCTVLYGAGRVLLSVEETVLVGA